MTVEMWLGVFPIPGRIAAYAQMAEQDGWDGIAVTDSQTNNGDAFCALNVAGYATSRIKLTTSATNADGARRVERPRCAGHRPRRFVGTEHRT
jgi:alkanesulfonate monooxygenase SsuD/methylene tetrahydromethanopterin reductase-like flavin-dependent oxidoreductase (luciferase family)